MNGVTKIGIDGIIISEAEFHKIGELQAELERTRNAKLIMQTVHESEFYYGQRRTWVEWTYLADDEVVRRMKTLMDAAAASESRAEESERQAKQCQEELLTAKFSWTYREYVMFFGSVIGFIGMVTHILTTHMK